MLSSKDILKKYDLSSVRLIFTGAAPLGKETSDELLRLYPKWRLAQGYGRPPDAQHIRWTRPNCYQA